MSLRERDVNLKGKKREIEGMRDLVIELLGMAIPNNQISINEFTRAEKGGVESLWKEINTLLRK